MVSICNIFQKKTRSHYSTCVTTLTTYVITITGVVDEKSSIHCGASTGINRQVINIEFVKINRVGIGRPGLLTSIQFGTSDEKKPLLSKLVLKIMAKMLSTKKKWEL